LLRAGVIGAGSMGRNHVRVYAELPQVELVAIADPAGAAKELARRFRCRHYRSHAEMLERERLDAVSIATPTHTHREVAEACISRGVHVLVEKPLAESAEEAEKIVRAAERQGVVLAVGHVERHNPAVARLKELVEQGELGEVVFMLSKRVGLPPVRRRSDNVFLDLAVHDIDLFNYLLSRMPERIVARGRGVFSRGREDQAVILLEYGTTTCVNFVNWLTPVKIRRLEITGTAGYSELDFMNQRLRLYENMLQMDYDSFGEFLIRFGKPREREVMVERAEPLKLELQDFVESVLHHRKPAVTGEDGVRAVRLVELAMQAGREQRAVRVDESW